jgi:hypothetical protein
VSCKIEVWSLLNATSTSPSAPIPEFEKNYVIHSAFSLVPVLSNVQMVYQYWTLEGCGTGKPETEAMKLIYGE